MKHGACSKKRLSNPNAADVHWYLSHVCRGLDDKQAAAKHFRRAVQLNPQLSRRPGAPAPSGPYVSIGKQDASFKPHAQAIEHNNRGVTLRNQGNREEVLAEYRKALKYQPDFALVHVNLGIALSELNRLDEALAAYQEALCRDPKLAPVHNNIGVILKNLGRDEEAVRHYRERAPGSGHGRRPQQPGSRVHQGTENRRRHRPL